MDCSHVFYFGDQSVDALLSLSDLLAESQHSHLLSTFLTSACRDLREAASLLPPPERDLFQGHDLNTLLDSITRDNTKHVAVSTVLSCVAQLGWLLRHREVDAQSWLHPNAVVIQGVCTGALASVAAAAALSDSDLLQLSHVFVPLAVRLGIEISRRSNTIEAASGLSWSTAISGKSLDKVQSSIKEFNKSKHLPPVKQVYISAYSASSITVSGPPSLLDVFTSSDALSSCRKLSLPIYGAFHAAHLQLSDSEIDNIVGNASILERELCHTLTLIHPGWTQPCALRDLLRSVVRRILQEPLDIDQDIAQLQAAALKHEGAGTLTSIGPARIRGLEKALNPSRVERFGSRQLSQTRALDKEPAGVQDGIAIVGMSGRFPGADSVDELWQLLMEGSDQHRIVPSDRFDVNTHVDPTGKIKNTSLTPYGCFYDRVGDFDISLFKISPREAAQTDPGQRLMLLTAYEALESAGYYDNGSANMRPNYGTFYGVAGDDYRQVNSSQEVDLNYITGGTRAFGPGRVSYYFGWEGPSMTIDAACSASGVAIHQAVTSLRQKDCHVALAGGANLLTCSDMFAGLSRAKFVNTTGPCKTFDETADGYCRADGFATVVFKRLEDAIRDKDHIHGVIRSIETKHAGTAISLTHPEAETQTALFRSVLSSAGLTVDDIDHIELHGTGTQAGDLAEATSVSGLLDQARPAHRPLTIASVKPNVGHSEAASGVTSLIKGLLMLQHETIPAHIGIKTRINPKLPGLDELGVVIPRTNMPYPANPGGGRVRRMLVNNFNATGGITALLLEEYKSQANSRHSGNDSRGVAHPVTLSAATAQSLRRMRTNLANYLQENPETSLSDLSYTLTARRLHHKHRFAAVGGSVDEMIKHLRSDQSGPSARQPTEPLHVFVFTGQTGVLPRASTLYMSNRAFREHMDRSEQLCVGMGLPPFLDVLSAQDYKAGVHRPVQVQLCLTSLQVGMARMFESLGIRPGTVIGHSLGEYAALCVANALSLADMLWLVGSRGLLLESNCTQGSFAMAVLNISGDSAKRELKTIPGVEIACLNSPQQTVISGPSTDIDRAAAQLGARGVKVKKLQTTYGFHSKQMDRVCSEYQDIARGINFQELRVPFASTLLGEVVTDVEYLPPDYLCRQTREPVRFQDAIQELDAFIGVEHTSVWVEFGATPACLPMIASTLGADPSRLIATMQPDCDNWTSIGKALTKSYLKNATIRWDEYHREYLDSLQLLQLPSYPFDLKRYWIQYEGDWIIRKNQTETVPGGTVLPPKIQLESSSLHAVIGDATEHGARKLVFRTDPSVLEKHHLEGPQDALFVDMAYSAVTHFFRVTGEEPSAMELCDLEIHARRSNWGMSTLRTTATRLPTDTNMIQITIASDDGSQRPTPFAQCSVLLSDGKAASVLANSNAYLYQSRMDLLQLFTANGQCLRLPDAHVGKIFGLDSPCLLSQTLVNSDLLEGTATITAPASKDQRTPDPAWTNALLQLPRLVLDSLDPGAHFHCSGWSKMHHLLALCLGHTYRMHVRLQPVDQGRHTEGDIHVIDSAGKAVTVILGVVFTSDGAGIRHPDQPAWLASLPEKAAPDDLSVGSSASSISEDKKSETSQADDSSSQASDTSDSSNDMLEPSSRRKEAGRLQSYTLGNEPTTKDRFDAILDILGSEIGVPVAELVDDIALEDLGVDSIIQISIVGRLQESLNMALSSTFLAEHNTVPKLRDYFGFH